MAKQTKDKDEESLDFENQGALGISNDEEWSERESETEASPGDETGEATESTPDSLKGKKSNGKKGKKNGKGKKSGKTSKQPKEPAPPKPEREIISSAVGEFTELEIGPPAEFTVKTGPEGEMVSITIHTNFTSTGKPETVTLEDWALHKLIEKSHRTLKIMYKDITSKTPAEQLVLIQQAFNMRKRPLKLLMSGKTVVSVVSTRHRQFDFAQTEAEIQKMVKDLLGEVQIEQLGINKLFRLPIDNKYVSAWLRINPGNNLAQGASAIRFSTEFRTEYDTKSGGKAPSCTNWAHVWTPPETLFGIKHKRVQTLADEIGAENIKVLTGRNIHTTNQSGVDVAKFNEFIQSLLKAVPKMEAVIEKTITSPLTKDEMKAILMAYNQKAGLSMYLIEDIMDAVQEETIWGLSQAVSYVRTHGDYKGLTTEDGKPIPGARETLNMTRVMENVAGEVFSIAPMIRSLQKEHGPITPKMLGITVKVPAKKKPIKNYTAEEVANAYATKHDKPGAPSAPESA